MVMEGFAGAFLGGLIGFAIGKDGKVVPITQEQINRLLRDVKPEFLKKVDIDTSIARAGDETSGKYDIAGSFILALNPTTPTDAVYIKLNEPTWPELPLTSLRRLIGPFYRFFVKNAAGSGTLNLIVAKGYQFQFIEKEEERVGVTLDTLNVIGDVSVPSPGDLYILYWDNATQLWKCRAFTAWLHASAHENDGADEISVAGLSGLLADDQHVLDAEVKAIKLDDFTAPDDTTDLDASAALHGLMPKADKSKLDGVDAGADVTGSNVPQAHKDLHDPIDGSDKLDTATPVKIGDANAIGSSHSLSRADHIHEKHHSAVATITFIIDGGGSAITTGQKGHLEIPFAGTITQVTMLADQSGSIVVDIWKDTYANFPPTDADSITASAVPTISTAQKSQDSTLTGWTTAITAGDILAFNVDSCTTIERVAISLRVTKT